MNKTIVIAGIVILVLVGGGLYVANQNSQQAEQAKMAQEKAAMEEKAAMQAKVEDKDAMVKKEGAAMEKSEDSSVGTGQDKMMKKSSASRYAEYSKAVLDQTAGHRRILYFYATWCPSCKIANADFKANPSRIPEDVTVIRVNYNDPDTDQEEKDLAKKYGITYQHTFVQIDGQGKQVTKWNGGNIDELLTEIK